MKQFLWVGFLGFEFLAAEGSSQLQEVFDFHASLRGVVGVTGDAVDDRVRHGHDPVGDALLQALELGVLGDFGFLESSVAASAFQEEDDGLGFELEEAFLKVTDLPGGMELRAGRYLNHMGLQNNLHLHDWQFADANLSTPYFLGEHGLTAEGVEISWKGELKGTKIAFFGSYGNAWENGHAHGENHEDPHDEDGDADHHDEDDEDLDGHAHGESLEDSYFTDGVLALRVSVQRAFREAQTHRLGLNLAVGGNGFGRDTRIFSGDYLFTWQGNGHGKRAGMVSAGVECFYRETEWLSEGVSGESGQAGLMFVANQEFARDWSLGLRYGWIEGVSDGMSMHHDGETEYGFEIEERQRLSMAVTWQPDMTHEIGAHLRLQYNHDRLDHGGTEDMLWLQFGFDLGGNTCDAGHHH